MVETLNYFGGWTEHANASLPHDGHQDTCSVVVDSPTYPYNSYIHLLGGEEHYRLLVSMQGLSEGREVMDNMSVFLQNHG